MSGPPPVLYIKSYWNTATSIHLCIMYGCFHTTTTEYQQQRPYGLKYSLSSPSEKKFADPCTREITMITQNLYTNVYNSSINYNQQLETTKMSFNRLMDVQTVAHAYNSTIKVNKLLIHSLTCMTQKAL